VPVTKPAQSTAKKKYKYTKTKHYKEEKTKTTWQENSGVNEYWDKNPKPWKNIR
jgi:hypothetical protein